MARMTEAEAWELDDLLTRTTPQLSGTPGGFFTEHKDHIVIVDDLSAAYLHSVAEAEQRTPTQIISELIRERIAAQV